MWLQGTHSELMAHGGLYSKLVQRQVLSTESRAEDLNQFEKLSWKSDSRRRRKQSSSSSEPEFNVLY